MAGQQDREESRAAMARIVNGKSKGDGKRKGKGNGKEVEGKKVNQRFCRVFSAQESRERLRIPPSFNQYLENEIGVVVLRGPSGNPWLADLASDSEGLFFENQWKDFVADHSLEDGDLVTFCYNGSSRFSVVIFDEMGIEKPSAFHAKPSYNLAATTESDEEDKQTLAAPQEKNNGTKKKKEKGNGEEVEGKKVNQRFCRVFSAQKSRERLRIPPSFNQYLENEIGVVVLLGPSGNPWIADLASYSEGLFFENEWKDFVADHSLEDGHILTFCYNGSSCFSVVIYDEMGVEKPSAFHCKPSYNLAATTESDEEDKQTPDAPQEKNNGTKKKSTGEIDANSSKLRKCSKGASVSYKSASFKSTEESNEEEDKQISSAPQEENNGAKKKRTREIDASSSKLTKRSKRTSAGYKSASLNSTEAIVKVQRQQAVMSRRPPVSEEQKNYALEKAKNYKSKYPITLQILKGNYVYNTFFMVIPSEFVRDYLPHSDKKLTLWDPQGMTWEVNYVYCSERCAGAFSGGWGKFSLGNHLEEFDVCVFELLAEDNIKVHVYRASAMLFEYIRDSSNK